MKSIKQQQEWCADQVDHPTQSWDNLCQSFARQSLGMGAYGSSAKVAWGNVKDKYKVKITKPSDKGWWADVPQGALLYSTHGTSGHAWVAMGNSKAFSNDYKRKGKIDVVPVDIPGWSSIKNDCKGYIIGAQYYEKDDSHWFGVTYDLWDQYVPPVENIINGMIDQTKANSAVWRLTCRLHDLGFGKSTPIRYEQTFPNKNYGLYCDANSVDSSTYTDATHIDIFG